MYTKEVKEMQERCIAIDTKYEGIDSDNVAISNNNLARFYCHPLNKLYVGDALTEKLQLALSHCQEAKRISIKIFGPTHEETRQYESESLAIVMQINSHSVKMEMEKMSQFKNRKC